MINLDLEPESSREMYSTFMLESNNVTPKSFTSDHLIMNSRSERFAKLAPMLRRLKHSVGKKRRDIIRKYDNDLICSLSECCHNVLKGNVPLTSTQKVKLRRHKNNLRKLSTKKTSIKAKKKILQRGGFLGALITPIFIVLGSLFNGAR